MSNARLIEWDRLEWRHIRVTQDGICSNRCICTDCSNNDEACGGQGALETSKDRKGPKKVYTWLQEELKH
eukprot:1149345-Pelagomonas_calceolata.AAC.13